MRRVLTGLLPTAMAVGLFFAAAPAANAAPVAAVHPASANTCPGYGSGSCTGTITTSNPGITASGTYTVYYSASGYICGETVTVTITNNHTGKSWTVSRTVSHCGSSHNASVSGPSPYTGVASSTITLPGGLPAGSYTLTALGSQSGVTSSTSLTLAQGTTAPQVCKTTSASTAHTSGIVLAAAYLSTSCKTALPATAGGPPSSGSNGNAAVGNAAPTASGSNGNAAVGNAAIGTAAAQGASQLPFTGFNAATFAAVGAIAIGAGGSLVLISRRRRRSAWQ